MSRYLHLRAWLLLLALGWVTVSHAQIQAPNAEKAGVTPGVPLPTGLGFFANPDNYHRFTLGIQAGLGVSASSETFGYDNLSANSKWRLGNNNLGRHLHALVGFSDWRDPAYRKVFADTDIDPLPDQDRFAAQSANAASVGLAYSRGRELADFTLTDDDLEVLLAYDLLINPATQWIPTYLLASAAAGETLTPVEQKQVTILRSQATRFTPPLNQAQKDSLTAAGFDAATQLSWQSRALTKAERATMVTKGIKPRLIHILSYDHNSPILQQRWTQQRNAYFLKLNRNKAREAAFSIGSLLRIASFAEETKLQAADLYATLAKGNASYDYVFAVHHLRYVEKALPHYAYTGAAGIFADLDDTNIFPVLGLTVGYGYYSFRELYDVIPEAPKLEQQPATRRLDVILSIAGAPDKTNQTGAGIGIRYSYIDPKLRPAYHAVALIFSSNFSLIE